MGILKCRRRIVRLVFGYLEVQDVSSGYSEPLEASKWVSGGIGGKQ